MALIPKRDHLIRLFNRLGLKTRQLKTEELIQLFFKIYNPGTDGQRLAVSEEYTTPMVQPAMKKPRLTIKSKLNQQLEVNHNGHAD